MDHLLGWSSKWSRKSFLWFQVASGHPANSGFYGKNRRPSMTGFGHRLQSEIAELTPSTIRIRRGSLRDFTDATISKKGDFYPRFLRICGPATLSYFLFTKDPGWDRIKWVETIVQLVIDVWKISLLFREPLHIFRCDLLVSGVVYFYNKNTTTKDMWKMKSMAARHFFTGISPKVWWQRHWCFAQKHDLGALEK